MTRIELSQWTQALKSPLMDLVVVGGGATGLGVAVQAALEGRRVALVEARDFASGTSSRSTKLLHGGVRYLAQGRLKLVQEALRERSIALELAPHLAQPLPFVVAERHWVSGLVTVLGLKGYEALAGRSSLGATRALSPSALMQIAPRLRGACMGVRFWDGQFEDARFALALAKTAHAAGAQVRNHTRVTGVSRTPEHWAIELRDSLNGSAGQLHARCIVNATGVWVDELHQSALRTTHEPAMGRLVQPSQGAHLVIGRNVLPLSEAILVPRTSDGRVLFAIPWMGSTMIGTTDTPRNDAPLEPRPFDAELTFLFSEVERHLGVRLRTSDVKSAWAGLRPLASESQKATTTSRLSREHVIVREQAGWVTVTGGKWTTYRSMAESVLDALVMAQDLPPPPRCADTRLHRLEGAPQRSIISLREAPGIHLFGNAAQHISAMTTADRPMGLGLSANMVRYSARHEWAITVEDMLARRWRALFLDARLAKTMAADVAQILESETGLDPQLSEFESLCDQYTLTASQRLVNASEKESRLGWEVQV